MSTVIDIYPASKHVPTFAELADAVQSVLVEHQSDPYLVEVLGSLTVGDMRPLIERIVSGPDFEVVDRFSAETELLSFNGHDYGWLSFSAVKAGFDFYFDDGTDYFEDLPHSAVIADYAQRAASIGTLVDFPFDRAAEVQWCWSLRMQAAKPLRTRLLAGCVAVALARLTCGFIHSEDGGVDYDRAPTDPETFLSWYPGWISEL